MAPGTAAHTVTCTSRQPHCALGRIYRPDTRHHDMYMHFERDGMSYSLSTMLPSRQLSSDVRAWLSASSADRRITVPCICIESCKQLNAPITREITSRTAHSAYCLLSLIMLVGVLARMLCWRPSSNPEAMQAGRSVLMLTFSETLS